MPNVRPIQTDFTSGVLDPLLAAREDIQFYYNGIKSADNVEVIPQGGLRRRPGLPFVTELAKKIEKISLNADMLSMPNGGDVANLLDGDDTTEGVTTTDLEDTNNFVVLHVDLGSAISVFRVDVVDFYLSAGALSDEFFVQYSTDDTAWSDYGTAFDLDVDARTRRRGGMASARYWRIVRVGATDMTTAKIHLGGFIVYRQTSSLSEARLLPFAFSDDEAYMMIVSDQNIDILASDEVVGHIGIEHTSSQLAILNDAQSFDTMELFHPDIAPLRIFRQGANDEFDFRDQVFENIPNFDFGAGVGGVDEVQLLNVDGVSSGDKFNLLLEGERTELVTVGTTAATATAIQVALRALSNTSSDGITVVFDTDAYEVTFSGGDGKRPWDDISISTHSGNGVWSTSKRTDGELPGEPIMSATRGWPRCGVLNHEQRAVYGGFKSLPDALLFSKISDPFNLDIDEDLDTAALLIRPGSANQQSKIHQIVGGRHLSVFANDGEFYFAGSISRDVIIPNPTKVGIKEGLRVRGIDGALAYIQGHVDPSDRTKQIGTALREFLFVDTEQSYQSNPLSVLASHLINNPVDMDLRKQVKTDDTDILFIINEDGSMTTLTTLRTQNVTAFTPHSLNNEGNFLAVGVNKSHEAYFVIEFKIDGTKRRFVCKRDPLCYLDGGARIVIESTSVTVADDATQSVFNWTFDNPAQAAAIGVRVDGVRYNADEYSVNLGSKSVTLNEAVEGGAVVRISKMQNRVDGADHLNGETVQTFIDGTPKTDKVVSSGGFDLDDWADTEIQYGFDFNVEATLMPLRVDLPDGSSALNKKRVVDVGLFLDKTGDIELSANGRAYRRVPLIRYDDDVLGQSMIDLLFTGVKEVTGLRGWTLDGSVSIRQGAPGPMTLLAVHRGVMI